MPTVINQSEILTLPSLYDGDTLTIAPKPLYPYSAALNAKIGLIRTDITKLHLPNGAIVNAANQSLIAGGGVCGAIHSAAGRELSEACYQLDGCPTGYAKITRAYELPCKNVIHAVGPVYWKERQENTHAKLLASCYTETLKLAVQNKLTAIAFCALSTGVYGYPSYEAAETAIEAVRKFLESDDGAKIELVVFCNFERKDEVAYCDLISTYFPPPAGIEDITEGIEDTRLTEATQPIETADGAVDARSAEIKSIEPILIAKISLGGETKETPKTEAFPPKSKPVNHTESEVEDDFVFIDKEDAEK